MGESSPIFGVIPMKHTFETCHHRGPNIFSWWIQATQAWAPWPMALPRTHPKVPVEMTSVFPRVNCCHCLPTPPGGWKWWMFSPFFESIDEFSQRIYVSYHTFPGNGSFFANLPLEIFGHVSHQKGKEHFIILHPNWFSRGINSLFVSAEGVISKAAAAVVSNWVTGRNTTPNESWEVVKVLGVTFQ